MTLQLAVLNPPCIHAGAYPKDPDRFICHIAYKHEPTRAYCRDRCPMKVTPGEHQFMKTQASYLGAVTGYPGDQRKGLGDLVESAINLVTFGQGKRIAKAVARKRGKKGCGCGKRKAALNRLGRSVRASKDD